MNGSRPTAKCLAVVGLLLITGCSTANNSESSTEIAVSGGGNQVFVANPGTIRVEVPKSVTAIEIRAIQPAGSLRVRTGEPQGSISGVITKAAVAAESDPNGGVLSIGIRGTGNPSAKTELRLPPGVQPTVRVEKGKGSLLMDLAGLYGGQVSLREHSGDVTIALSDGGNQTVEIQRGEGKVTIQIPAWAAVLVRGNGTSVIVPPSFNQVVDGVFASASFSDEAPATVVDVHGFSGSVEIRTQ